MRASAVEGTDIVNAANGNGIKQKIDSYRRLGEHLSLDKISLLLQIDSIYPKVPSDSLAREIKRFRELNTYLDPYIALKKDKITFLRIVDSKLDDSKLKEKFNRYLNVKYNHIANPATFNQNMDKFIRQSKIVTKFLDDVLHIGNLPEEAKEVLSEKEVLKANPNIFELMKLYRGSKDKRLRFEILRKVGLVDIVSRIEKSFPLEQTDFVAKEVEKLFSIGLGLKRSEQKKVFVWLDEDNRVKYTHDHDKAQREHSICSRRRDRKALDVLPLQSISYTTCTTQFGKDIELMQIRNKLRKSKEPYYTSFMEKMVRKNLEFPNQIHDTIGVRIVVKDQESIPGCISMLEKFVGGSSSRKKEKDTIHKFGKEKLNPYSSKEYYVWKAIYDIALPNFAIKHLMDIRKSVKDKEIQRMITKKIDEMQKSPVNTVIEVQVHDLESYLLSIAKGNSAEHAKLKMNEIRRNSLFKLFPAEIYKKELRRLRDKITRRKS